MEDLPCETLDLIGKFMGPLATYSLSITCKGLSGVAKRFDRRAFVTYLEDKRGVERNARLQPRLASLLSLECARWDVCSVCRKKTTMFDENVKRFDGSYAIFAHTYCLREEVLTTFKFHGLRLGYTGKHTYGDRVYNVYDGIIHPSLAFFQNAHNPLAEMMIQRRTTEDILEFTKMTAREEEKECRRLNADRDADRVIEENKALFKDVMSPLGPVIVDLVVQCQFAFIAKELMTLDKFLRNRDAVIDIIKSKGREKIQKTVRGLINHVFHKVSPLNPILSHLGEADMPQVIARQNITRCVSCFPTWYKIARTGKRKRVTG